MSRHVSEQLAGPGIDWQIVYGTLYDNALGILFCHDPVGLNFDDNTDEYWPEVAAILPRLRDAATVEQAALLIHAVFVQHFSLHVAGPPPRYIPIARDLWSAWQQHRGQRSLPPPAPAREDN